MEKDQERLQTAVHQMIGRLELNHLNGVAKQAYLCSASCYDKKLTSDGVSDCVVQCQASSQNCQRVVTQELGEFQQRLQRAMMACQDKVREELTPMITKKDADQATIQQVATTKFEACAGGVVNEHIAMIKNLEARIKSQL